MATSEHRNIRQSHQNGQGVKKRMLITFTDLVLFSTYFLLLFLSLFWLLVLLTSGEEEPKKKIKSHPFFTAIVPAYNEEETATATLASLVSLDYPPEKMEIIVVNDGSKDKTRETVEKFIARYPQRKIKGRAGQ